ncbi:MAG TPA: hypothetical protein VJ440_10230, partial [Candidatus Brocadiaceae bacterium]|nr:hypothetical protein [Candidatus Brocadiaceae bacterium]
MKMCVLLCEKGLYEGGHGFFIDKNIHFDFLYSRYDLKGLAMNSFPERRWKKTNKKRCYFREIISYLID